ncbi:parathymosin [Phodopus roborovskii]|uniref:parathymosin n=1 Tax=Phodopus roborovskii TaxID=109678 RepID=UPI0021E4F5D1|nr:parathymosin [Phodopus roborovskii]
MSGPANERPRLSFALSLSSSRPPRESGQERTRLAGLPLLPAFGFSNTYPASPSNVPPSPPPQPPPPIPLAKFQGFGEVSRSLATSPGTPPRARLQLAGSRLAFGAVSPCWNPTPSHLLAPLGSRPSRQSLHFPLLVSSFLPPLSLSRPSLSSSYPHLSNLLFHPPPLASPPRSCLPHPWEAPPVGQRRLKSGFPSRGRQRLVGGSSAGAGAASKTERLRPERAGHRPHHPPASPPALRTAAALRVSARDPPPPHPARLCRLLQRVSLPSGRRCRCRRRHRAKFRPRPPSAVQGPSASAPGPRLPASPGPGTMSEKSVEAAAELSAKDLKEKKEKVEEKAGRKERKKEVVEEEENGAEEEEEETAEDGEDDDEGDEEDEEEEEEEDEGPVRKRTAEEEDEADPKRQKTENGASA